MATRSLQQTQLARAQVVDHAMQGEAATRDGLFDRRMLLEYIESGENVELGNAQPAGIVVGELLQLGLVLTAESSERLAWASPHQEMVDVLTGRQRSIFVARWTYSRKGCSHVFNVVPRSASLSEALAPPHLVCPQTTTFLTLRWVTAYSTTDAALTSSACTQLAMLRWTKMSPGWHWQMVVSGTRLSAHPIHSNSGHWPLVSSSKACGFFSAVR